MEVSRLLLGGPGLVWIQSRSGAGGFVQTCLPFVPVCRTPRLHDVISDALSWNSSKLNN